MMKLYPIVAFLLMAAHTLQAAPKFLVSDVVTRTTPGHSVPIEIDIAGASRLYLEVQGAANGTGYDWADWMEPTLSGPEGTRRLTDLKWAKATGRVQLNKNQGGGPLRVNGQPVPFGIGVHAESMLIFDLPKGFTTFKARGGLDNGGTDQAGSHSSVRFVAYTNPKDRPIPPLDINLPPGFRAERLYSVNLATEGSWVVLGLDGKGRLVSSDRQGPLFRIEVPPVGQAGGETRVEPIPVDVGRANGLLHAFGSLYVVGIGSGSFNGKSGLFRLTDTNGDDRYDKVEHLMTMRVGSDHHAHAVLLSPDGKRLVILAGNNTDMPGNLAARHIQHQAEDHLLPRSTYYGHNTGRKAPGGFVITCLPDGSDRRIQSAGYRNPYDIAFNQAGDLFTFDADMEYDVGGPWYRPTRVNHSVSGGEFGWRWGAGKWPNHFPDAVGTVVDIGRGSPTGIAFGYGARFPEKYQRALYLCDWTYGKIYAVHLKPDGATYTGEFETFLGGKSLPASDIVIRPQDGAMYFTVGGRRAKSSLIRVTYQGDESTRPVKVDDSLTPLHRIRRELESWHGQATEGALAKAWPFLSHDDRAIRYAARTVVEHQPLDQWAARAVKESQAKAAIESAVALARSGGKAHREAVLDNLDRLSFKSLAVEQQLDLLRAYGLVFIRLGNPSTSRAADLAQRLSPSYPAKDNRLNHELCQMLLYLEAQGAVPRTVRQLLAANTQADQMFYAYHLRTIRNGWSDADLKSYFGWIRQAEANGGDYTGGGHFRNFLKMIRRESLARLSEDQKTLVAPILAAKPEPARHLLDEREMVRNWTVADLTPAMARVETGRSFIRGKSLYNNLCATCHLFKGQGGALGPDLTSVGGKYDAAALLTEIIEPSKVISDQHASVTLKLRNGTSLFGRETGGNDDSVFLAINPFAPDETMTVKKSDIVERKISKISMMPQGMINILTEEEILDMVMFLLSGGDVRHTAFQR